MNSCILVKHCMSISPPRDGAYHDACARLLEDHLDLLRRCAVSASKWSAHLSVA